MKTHTKLLCLAVTALGLAALARAESASGPNTPPPDVLRRFDANVNGKLDPEELAKWKAEEEKNAQSKAARLAAKEKKEAAKKKKNKKKDDNK
jgi:hypothetical protein